MANAARSVEISEEWQLAQSKPRAAENMPITSMNSSTGMPFRTWIFSKTVSDIGGA